MRRLGEGLGVVQDGTRVEILVEILVKILVEILLGILLRAFVEVIALQARKETPTESVKDVPGCPCRGPYLTRSVPSGRAVGRAVGRSGSTRRAGRTTTRKRSTSASAASPWASGSSNA